MLVAAFIGEALANGALGYIAGDLLSSALGKAKIDDVKEWIKGAVKEIEAFVSDEMRRQLDEHEINGLNADLSSVYTQMNEYAALPPDANSRYLITNVDTATSRLTAAALHYDQAIFVATAAEAFRLTCLFALFKDDKNFGHVSSEKERLESFVKAVSDMRDRIANNMAPEVRVTSRIMQLMAIWYCDIYVDGVLLWQAWNDHHDDLQIQYENHLSPTIERIKAERQSFLDNANTSISSLQSVYEKMVAAKDSVIGGHALLATHVHVGTKTVVPMRGAVAILYKEVGNG